MRLVVGGGGTGGHVYPALAVAAALQAAPYDLPAEQILYLGARGRPEAELAPRAGVAFSAIAAGAVRERGPAELVRSGFRTLYGTAQAWMALRRFRPAAILGTGGYVSVPLILAGWLRGIPTLVYVPDIAPGLAAQTLSRLATKVAVTALPTIAHLPPGKTAVTGYPVRREFRQIPKAAARARWGLDPAAKTLLVWGGSQGSRSINQAVSKNLEELLSIGQIIHVCGTEDNGWLTERRQALTERQQARYHLYPYLFEGVPEALCAADLAVSRAGASILGEFTATRLPAILVPYSHAGGHQAHNARYLADAGAAVLVEERRLQELAPTVAELLRDEARLQLMAERAGTLAQPEAAGKVAQLLLELARGFMRTAQSRTQSQAR